MSAFQNKWVNVKNFMGVIPKIDFNQHKNYKNFVFTKINYINQRVYGSLDSLPLYIIHLAHS